MNDEIYKKLIIKLEQGVLLDLNVMKKVMDRLTKKMDILSNQNRFFFSYINGLGILNGRLTRGCNNFRSMMKRYDRLTTNDEVAGPKICNFCGRRFLNFQAVRAHLKGCDFYKEEKLRRKKIAEKVESFEKVESLTKLM